MVGKIYIESTGYDPDFGKEITDPFLGPVPTLGACRPDFRKHLKVGDHLFVVTGKVADASQFVLGGFEVVEKIHANEAYRRFPELRLKFQNGVVKGNIIVDAKGNRNPLDTHDPESFERRAENYLVGANLISLSSEAEIALGRSSTLSALQDILKSNAKTPFLMMGRGCNLTESQVLRLREWLKGLKIEAQKQATRPAKQK